MGPIELQQRAKGFFTLIFAGLEDHKRMVENNSYFMYNVGLFMHLKEECYYSKKSIDLEYHDDI